MTNTNNQFSQIQSGKSPSFIIITIQLFAWAILMSFILGIFGISFAGIFGWIMIPPMIVGQHYTKKYHVVMPKNLRKYSTISYMSLSCLLGLLIIVPLLFILQAEKPIESLGSAIAGVLLFMVVYFVLGSLSVYSLLGVEPPEKGS